MSYPIPTLEDSDCMKTRLLQVRQKLTFTNYKHIPFKYNLQRESHASFEQNLD